MKTHPRLIAAAVAIAVAGPAFANTDIADSQSGNGSLFLNVVDAAASGCPQDSRPPPRTSALPRVFTSSRSVLTLLLSGLALLGVMAQRQKTGTRVWL